MNEFFRPPTDAIPPSGVVSPLYLLRREIQDCLIGKVIDESRVREEPQRHRLFASTMVIFAGIDLLGKFAFPELAMRERFCSFISTYGTTPLTPIGDAEAKAILRYRNGLMHQFGLEVENVDGVLFPMFMFQDDKPAPVIQRGEAGWQLSIDDLYVMFVGSIERYRDALRRSPSMMVSFLTAYRDYGRIQISA
jgi:hypothetical protein